MRAVAKDEAPQQMGTGAQPRNPWLKGRRATVLLAILTLIVLLLSVPSALRDAFESGGVYLFSHEFFADIPKRLSGPGRFRFVLQPLFAVILGIRSGWSDARQGRPPYLYGLILQTDLRRELLGSAFKTVVNLILMGILVDSVCQWLILGSSYPGAALVVGPVLILLPYSIARAFSNRFARVRKTMKES